MGSLLYAGIEGEKWKDLFTGLKIYCIENLNIVGVFVWLANIFQYAKRMRRRDAINWIILLICVGLSNNAVEKK